MTPMQHAMYDPLLVAVSVIIATFASYTALDLARSVSSARGLARGVWQCGGAVAMGVGIWSMHFVGMLALHTPGLRISYDIPLLVLSVVVAVIASGVALYAVSRPRVVGRAVFAAGVAMGAAICGMHYIGIAGMNMAAAVTWNWVLVAASVAIAIIAAFAALWLAFRFRGEGLERRFPAQVCSAIAMGIAISGMHYTAMAAMQITPLSGGAHHTPAMARDVLASDGLAQAVIAGTLVILGIALASSAFQRALARRSRLAREQAANERAKIEAALRRAAELLSNSLQTGDVLREITTGTMEATAADLAYIEQIDPAGDAVVVAAAAGEWAPELHRSTALDQSITALLLASHEAFVSGCSTSVSHAAADASEGGREMSFVAAGIRDGLRHAALVVARRPDQEPFGNEEITRVLTFSHLASLALRRLAQAEDAERRREELEQVERVAALGRVASSLAHQFNNILMSISAVSEAAARQGTIESFRRAAPHIERAVARGKDVTETLLRLNGATRPRPEPVELCGWLQSLSPALQDLAPAGHLLQVETSECPLFAEIDRGHMAEVVTHLVRNAYEASPAAATVTVTLFPDSDESPDSPAGDGGATGGRASRVHFAVSDHGSGMSSETVRRAFEPLFSARPHCSGLGLTISHEIVRSHRGTISIESTPAAGTTVHVLLPSTTQPASTGKVEEQNEPTICRIALVEDDDTVAEGLILMLELSAVDVRRVALGREAMAAIEAFQPDAVILDLGLPDISGAEVYAEIERRMPSLPVVFSTGHGDETFLSAALDRPHVAFLRKPFSGEELMDALQATAGKWITVDSIGS